MILRVLSPFVTVAISTSYTADLSKNDTANFKLTYFPTNVPVSASFCR